MVPVGVRERWTGPPDGMETRPVFRLFYDEGAGLGAALTAALDVGRFPEDLPWDEVAVRDLLQTLCPGSGIFSLRGRRGVAYWCGLGPDAPVIVRAWRQFLAFSPRPQDSVVFLPVSVPRTRRWRRAERAWRERAEVDRAAKEAVGHVELWHQARLSVWPG